MVRSVTVFDEDFTEDDMTAALEWQSDQNLRCSHCGGFTDETTAVGADDNYDAEMVTCHRCAVSERTERAFRTEHGEMVGVRIRSWEID